MTQQEIKLQLKCRQRELKAIEKLSEHLTALLNQVRSGAPITNLNYGKLKDVITLDYDLKPEERGRIMTDRQLNKEYNTCPVRLQTKYRGVAERITFEIECHQIKMLSEKTINNERNKATFAEVEKRKALKEEEVRRLEEQLQETKANKSVKKQANEQRDIIYSRYLEELEKIHEEEARIKERKRKLWNEYQAALREAKGQN